MMKNHSRFEGADFEAVVFLSQNMPVNPGPPCEHLQLCLWDTYRALKFYLALEQLSGDSKDGSSFPAMESDLWHGKLEFNQMASRALEWVQIFRLFQVFSRHNFALDGVNLGIWYCFETSTVPIWTSFGLQVFLDIEDVMGKDINEPFRDLQSSVRLRLEEHRDNTNYKNPFSSQENQLGACKDIRVILDQIREVSLDDLFNKQLSQLGATLDYHPILKPVMEEGNFILKRHPLRCGTLKYDLYYQLQQSGVVFEEVTWHITTLAYVYAACRIIYPDEPVWPDMEMMLWRQHTPG
jgi:hypothetical protein